MPYLFEGIDHRTLTELEKRDLALPLLHPLHFEVGLANQLWPWWYQNSSHLKRDNFILPIARQLFKKVVERIPPATASMLLSLPPAVGFKIKLYLYATIFQEDVSGAIFQRSYRGGIPPSSRGRLKSTKFAMMIPKKNILRRHTFWRGWCLPWVFIRFEKELSSPFLP